MARWRLLSCCRAADHPPTQSVQQHDGPWGEISGERLQLQRVSILHVGRPQKTRPIAGCFSAAAAAPAAGAAACVCFSPEFRTLLPTVSPPRTRNIPFPSHNIAPHDDALMMDRGTVGFSRAWASQASVFGWRSCDKILIYFFLFFGRCAGIFSCFYHIFSEGVVLFWLPPNRTLLDYGFGPVFLFVPGSVRSKQV